MTTLLKFCWTLPTLESDQAAFDVRTILLSNDDLKEIQADFENTTFGHLLEIRFKLLKLEISAIDSTELALSLLKSQAQTRVAGNSRRAQSADLGGHSHNAEITDAHNRRLDVSQYTGTSSEHNYHIFQNGWRNNSTNWNQRWKTTGVSEFHESNAKTPTFVLR